MNVRRVVSSVFFVYLQLELNHIVAELDNKTD
jgi:hypothetical protein